MHLQAESEPTPQQAAALLPHVEAALALYGPAAPALSLAPALAHYLALVAWGNRRVRLVGSADPPTLARRHLGESLFLATLLPLDPALPLVDLGSGAGFPGLALALATPGLNTTLVESNGKKAAFLRAAIAALGLAARVEVWDQFLNHRPTPVRAPLAGASLVTVRALERMETVPAWLGRWLDPGARAAFWVTGERARAWRARYPAWGWSRFRPLPGSRERGIVVGERST